MPMSGKEQRVAGGHHSVDGAEAGSSVVGMDLIALPGIVAQQDVRLARRICSQMRRRSSIEYSSSPST